MARNSLRVTKVFDPARLQAELAAAGVNVVTLRASRPDMGGPAIYGVVVFEGAAADVQTVVDAHVEARVPSRTVTATERDKALAEMEKI